MCKAPKPPKPKEPKKPQFMRNRYLDEYVGGAAAVNTLKQGRSALRVPMAGPTPIGGAATPAPAPTPTASPTPVAPRPRLGINENPNRPRQQLR
jgi:hypothetical protein